MCYNGFLPVEICNSHVAAFLLPYGPSTLRHGQWLDVRCSCVIRVPCGLLTRTVHLHTRRSYYSLALSRLMWLLISRERNCGRGLANQGCMIESLAKTYIATEHCPLHPSQNLADASQNTTRLMRRCICICHHRRLQIDYHASAVCTPCQYALS